MVTYETAPHDTKLTIEIDPLRLTLPETQRNQPQIGLKPNEQYRISGLLLDSSLNVPIPSKRVFFENAFFLIFFLLLNLMVYIMLKK